MDFAARTWISGLCLTMVAAVGCGGGAAPAGYGAKTSSAEPGGGYGPSTTADMAAPQAAPAPAMESEASGSLAGTAPMKAGPGGDGVARREERPAEPQNRPGLGTEWGETRSSKITTSPFVRADGTNPVAMASVFYNDAEGARAMASAVGFRQLADGQIDIGNGIATLGLKDDRDRFLSGFEASDKKFIVGRAGDRYSIVVKSHVPARLEIVVSVDGLDVLDGKAASFSKRGYLIEPHGQIEIDGFRQSAEAVAAFRFGSVRDSYAQKKHGEARNVGVIGVALFHERGSSPASWPLGDTQKRLDANPFPGQFATPP
jgi:hypothetical protein